MKTYYLIDTNVYIDCPDILDRIPDGDCVIIPGVVLKELDGLHKSQDQHLRVAVKNAQNSILYNSGRDEIEMLQLQEPYYPFEEPTSSDQKILSAAFRTPFCNGKVILLTSDVNMRLVAESVKISSLSKDEFLNGNFKKKKAEDTKTEKNVDLLKVIKCVGLLASGFAIGWTFHSFFGKDNTPRLDA